jgi:hypothetical protein
MPDRKNAGASEYVRHVRCFDGTRSGQMKSAAALVAKIDVRSQTFGAPWNSCAARAATTSAVAMRRTRTATRVT